MSFPRGLLAASLLCCAVAVPYSVQAQTAEVTTKDTPVTFTSGTNLVPVPVVVRDAQGHAVGNLNLDDFQLFDNGKAQAIAKFSVEKIAAEASAAQPPNPKPAAPASAAPLVPADATKVDIPDRFIAYLFDDLHLNPADLVRTRDAAKRQLDSQLRPLSRAAIYTTSGHQSQEFTNDRDKLHAALDGITAIQAMANKALMENSCPPVDYYMADRIYNQHDLSAWAIATKDALYCGQGGPAGSDVQPSQISQCEASGASDSLCTAVRNAKQAARAAVDTGNRDADSALGTLQAVVSRMASMPGQRSIVLISPGFLVLDGRQDQENAIVNRAIKANVVIGGLDARGLYSDIQGGDAGDRGNNKTIVEKRPYQSQAILIQSDVVANLAEGTGGTFFHGRSDFDEGMARVAASPEYIYVLAFSPHDLKLDGAFHTLKVTLKNAKGMELQVRKGYYAPKSSTDAAGQSQQQIEEAFFSRNEIHDLPAVLQTQFFRTDNSGDATLSAVAKVDVKKLAFHKEGDRNRNDITVVTGVFDNDGNYVVGAQKIVEMRLLDETLEKRVGSGISVRSSFTVHPGRYVVRLVVRDSEGKLMSAQSSLVEIP